MKSSDMEMVKNSEWKWSKTVKKTVFSLNFPKNPEIFEIFQKNS